jgi:hypothetical protein
VARVVGVHGIAQQHKGEDVLLDEWLPALHDGLRRAGPIGATALDSLRDGDVCCAFYGDLFREPGRALAVGDPWLSAEDATDVDAELLLAWWQGAADSDPAVVGPDERALAATPRTVQAALRALSRSRFFAGIADRALLFDLAQVRRYVTEPATREQIQARVESAVTDDTTVLIGHSLGSVVAYEALCAHPEWPVRTLVTLGSPLGIRNVIFDRLRPAPEPPPDGGRPRGAWPGPVTDWTNVADEADVVALEKDLRSLFGPAPAGRALSQWLIDNGAHAHAVRPYLSAAQAGHAIAAGLAARA